MNFGARDPAMGTALDREEHCHAAHFVGFAEGMVNVQECARRMGAAAASTFETSTRASTELALARVCVVIPALDAEKTLGAVIDDVRRVIPECSGNVLVVDDGSTDATAAIAHARSCIVVSHGKNRGKGAALRTAFATAAARGFDVALTVDADGQHPAEEARRVLLADPDPHVFVLGVRDLVRDGAPRANVISNGISNYFLSRFSRRPLRDTQCGLRRYPIRDTLALAPRGEGYDFEAEVLLRACRDARFRDRVVETTVRVLYPASRVTHFHVARDPWRIIRTVVATMLER